MLPLAMSVFAAIAFAVGGIFMKLSIGLSDPLFSLLVYLCFGFGATAQTVAISKTDLGGTYISILGLEAVATLLFSIWLFREQQTPFKLFGLAMIVAGVVMLRGSK